MEDNISVGSTIKVFENGVLEINKLKMAIQKLNNTVEELTNFNEIIDLEINSSKMQSVNKALGIIVEKHKETLSLFENVISVLNEENKIKTNNIKLGVETFSKEVELISNHLNSIDFNLNNNIIEKLLKDLSHFINNIENKYKDINERYIVFEDLSGKINNLLNTVNSIGNIIDNTQIDNQIQNILKRINELDSKYNKINESIEKFDKNINCVNKKFENNEVLIKTDKIFKDLEVFNKNVNQEYEKIELKYKDINLLGDKINNAYEESIKGLEKKLDLLIEENKAFKLAYSTREIEDNIFKEEIMNIIKDSMVTIDRESTEVKINDIDRLKELAKQGDINASFKLAQTYYKGNDISKNIDLAVRYYMIGAKCNHSESINELIKIYKEEAFNGNIKYQRILGIEYLKGNLINSNIEESIKWLTIASENGSQDAKNRLDKVRNEYKYSS